VKEGKQKGLEKPRPANPVRSRSYGRLNKIESPPPTNHSFRVNLALSPESPKRLSNPSPSPFMLPLHTTLHVISSDWGADGGFVLKVPLICSTKVEPTPQDEFEIKGPTFPSREL
jgi:hypothetical protein